MVKNKRDFFVDFSMRKIMKRQRIKCEAKRVYADFEEKIKERLDVITKR